MSNNLFNQVQMTKPRKNIFNLSHERKFSMNMGNLTPILCEEIVPGDKWRIKSEALIRMAPMLSPVMHRVNVFTHFFFVPNRLTWKEWQDFITGGSDGTSNPMMPYINFSIARSESQRDNNSLAAYLGCPTIPVGNAQTATVNAMPFRAYQMIFNEYYRDQDLVDKIAISTDSGSDSNYDDLLDMRQRAWEKDYFTSARPFTQKGAEVELPLLGNADVVYKSGVNPQIIHNVTTGDPASDVVALGTDAIGALDDGTNILKVSPSIYEADMSGVSSATIIELRNATRLQEWLEKNARGGSRYIEQMWAHFGVKSSDARLQRPEYIGGGRVPMLISEVLQTSETNTTPQATMSGHGVSSGSSPTFKYYAEEHGYIIGIMSVLPKTTYQQGFRRHFMKTDKFDYFWPSFEHIGEQAIYKSELYHDYSTAFNNDAFGYQSRYSEYKTIPSSVHGEFRDSSLFWHMGRKFAALPVLNADFIQTDPTDGEFMRIYAVQDASDKLWCIVYNDVKAIRPMARFSNPKL